MLKVIACLMFLSTNYFSCFAQEASLPGSEPFDSLAPSIRLTYKAITKDNKIHLEWTSTGKEGFYIVERSVNLKGFEMIGVIKSRAANQNFEFTDEQPSFIHNYYRIKMELTSEQNIYSDTISAGLKDTVFCKFYPNPVDKLLMLRSDYSAGLKITDVSGRTRILQQLKPGLQILDVSCLEKSVYVITIFNEESNHFITGKLIKN